MQRKVGSIRVIMGFIATINSCVGVWLSGDLKEFSLASQQFEKELKEQGLTGGDGQEPLTSSYTSVVSTESPAASPGRLILHRSPKPAITHQTTFHRLSVDIPNRDYITSINLQSFPKYFPQTTNIHTIE